MSIKIGNTIGEYLKDLEVTVDQLADTWRPGRRRGWDGQRQALEPSV